MSKKEKSPQPKAKPTQKPNRKIVPLREHKRPSPNKGTGPREKK